MKRKGSAFSIGMPAVSFAAAEDSIPCIIVNTEYKHAKALNTMLYLNGESAQYAKMHDNFMGTHTASTHIEKNDSGTHTASSGGTHRSSSGKF